MRDSNCKVAAYITAYEDIDAVENCVTSLLEQSYHINEIFIIDNSRTKLSSPILNNANIVIESHPENIGIASGLGIAIRWALERGYDFLWTFDQDSEPLPNTLEKLVFGYTELSTQNDKIGIVAPLTIDIASKAELGGAVFKQYRFIPAEDGKGSDLQSRENYYECDVVITSGSLVSLDAAKYTKLPNEDLFIDSVDWEYCMNFRQNDYKIFVLKDALLKHNFGDYNSHRKSLRNNLVPVYTYSALRYYYTCRNHTFIESRLANTSGHLPFSVLMRFYAMFRKVTKVALYESEGKSLKIWACFRGTFDGFFGRLGKTW
jgi:rhamnosyltransferase